MARRYHIAESNRGMDLIEGVATGEHCGHSRVVHMPWGTRDGSRCGALPSHRQRVKQVANFGTDLRALVTPARDRLAPMGRALPRAVDRPRLQNPAAALTPLRLVAFVQLKPPVPEGLDHRLCAVVDGQFPQDRCHMILDGLIADREGASDFLVGLTVRRRIQYA